MAQEDQYFNAAMMEKIKQGLKEAENGEYIEIRTSEEIKQLLGL